VIPRLVGDCASDPPLGATARALAVRFPDELVYGLGKLALERKLPRDAELVLVVRHADARDALAAAIERAGAKVELRRLPDAWPAWFGDEGVDAQELLHAARPGAPRFVTVAGAVARPSVIAARPEASAEELVAQAGGATPEVDDAWVALDLGSLLLVLPAAHEAVRRARTPIADWLVRAASACEGCRMCTDSCPPALGGAPLAPHEVVRTLSTMRDDGVDLARTLACTGCGLCDAVCPSSLSPRTLTVAVRDRLREHATPAPARGEALGLDVPLLTLRLGLADYAREPEVRF
jgi:ferredoxin